MSKKIWIFLLALCLVIVSACALADEHTHSWEKGVCKTCGEKCTHEDEMLTTTKLGTDVGCEKQRVFKVTCSCGGYTYYYLDYDHTIVDTYLAADCENPDRVGKHCTKCDYEEAMQPVPGSVKLDHDLVVIKDLNPYMGFYKEATCAEKGFGFYKCDRCTKFDADGKYTSGLKPYSAEIEKAEHKCTVGPEKLGADCENPARWVLKCENYKECGYYEVVAECTGADYEAAKGPHDWTGKGEEKATCVKTGATWNYCKKCQQELPGSRKVVPVDSSKHVNVREYTIRGAGCEAGKPGSAHTGIIKVTCEDCGKVYYELVEAQHTDRQIPMKGHIPATCGAPAQGKLRCVTCYEVYEDKTPATGEHETYVLAKLPATCTLPERLASVCAECGALEKDTEVTNIEGSKPNGHDWDWQLYLKDNYKITLYVKPTCTTPGAAWAKECRECGEQVNGVVVLPALEHDTKGVTAQVYDATCTEPAYYAKACKNCGELLEKVAVVGSEPLNHDFTNKKNVKTELATCVKDGYEVVKCTRCDEVDESTKKILHKEDVKHTTVPTDTIIAVDCATETNGIYKVKCTVEGCNYVGYEFVPYEHTLWSDPPAAETCKDEKKDRWCKVCNAKFTITIKGDKNLCRTTEVPELADCKHPDRVVTKCTVCGDVKKIVDVEGSEKLQHVYEEIKDELSTCLKAGYAHEECKLCHDKKPYYALPLADHVWGDPEEVRVEDGVVEHKCTVCKNWYPIDFTKPETPDTCKHDEVVLPGYAATCTTDGLTDGKYCIKCGKTTVAQTVIPAKGHTAVDAEGDIPFNCITGGYDAGKVCEYCGITMEAGHEIPATGEHTFDKGHCTVCGAEDTTYCAHDNVKKTYSFNADFTKRVVTVICKDCGETVDTYEEDF